MSGAKMTSGALFLAFLLISIQSGFATASPASYHASNLEGSTVGHVVRFTVSDALSLQWEFCSNLEPGQDESGFALFVYSIEGNALSPSFLVSGGRTRGDVLTARVAVNAPQGAPIAHELGEEGLSSSATCVSISQSLQDGGGDFVAVASYLNGSSSGRVFNVRANPAAPSMTLTAVWQHTTREAYFKFARDLQPGLEISALATQALVSADDAFESTETAVYGSFGFDTWGSHHVGAYWLDVPNGERHFGCPLDGFPTWTACDLARGFKPELFVGPPGTYRLTLAASAKAEMWNNFRGIWVNAPLPPGIPGPWD